MGKEVLIRLLSLLTLALILGGTYYYFTTVRGLDNNTPDIPSNDVEGPNNVEIDIAQQRLNIKTAALTALAEATLKGGEFFAESGREPNIKFDHDGDYTHMCFTFHELDIMFDGIFHGYLLIEFVNDTIGEILVFISDENFSIRLKSLEDIENDSNNIFTPSAGPEAFGCPTLVLSR